MQNKKIQNLVEYIQLVSSLKQKQLLFRGQPGLYQLLPSIGRKHNQRFLLYEAEFYAQLKYELPNMIPHNIDPVSELAIFQHYGVPTRLLDVTENPLVALYFACQKESQKSCADGEVFVFGEDAPTVCKYPIAKAIASLGVLLRDGNGSQTDKDLWKTILRGSILSKNEKKLYDCNTFNQCMSKPLFVSASKLLMRQNNQKGKYILFPNHRSECGNGYSYDKRIDPIAPEDERLLKIIKIPASHKKAILTELDNIGVNEAFIFQDNVDRLCHYYVSKYLSDKE